jgi:hypothetical protein
VVEYLARCVRPWVQSSAPKKKKRTNKRKGNTPPIPPSASIDCGLAVGSETVIPSGLNMTGKTGNTWEPQVMEVEKRESEISASHKKL